MHVELTSGVGALDCCNNLVSQHLTSGLLDTPKDRLLHYAVFFHF
jgi:hypothetical protein